MSKDAKFRIDQMTYIGCLEAHIVPSEENYYLLKSTHA